VKIRANEVCKVGTNTSGKCVWPNLSLYYVYVYCVKFTFWILMSNKFSINYLMVCLPAQKYCTHKITGFLDFIKCWEFWTECNISDAVSVLGWKSVEVTIWLVPVERVGLSHWCECFHPSRFFPTHLPEDGKKETFPNVVRRMAY
jgi:hypothetical protein